MVGLAIGPGDLLKLATHSQVKLLPAVPPMPIPVRGEEEAGEGDATADEAASDPPSPEEVRDGGVGEGDAMAGGDVLRLNDCTPKAQRKFVAAGLVQNMVTIEVSTLNQIFFYRHQ